MMNLFSTFEPSTFIIPSWLFMVIMFTIIANKMWMIKNPNKMKKSMLKDFNKKENKTNFNLFKGKSMPLIMLFTFIMFNNVMGMFPYTFTPTSHMAITFSLALPIWMMSIMMPIFSKTKELKAHLIPMGTPLAMTPFMVCVELISLSIRPITLSVRLAANIIAGHLILTLMSNLTTNMMNVNIKMTILMMQMILLTLETMVAIIQAYVFTMLSTLYLSEFMN